MIRGLLALCAAALVGAASGCEPPHPGAVALKEYDQGVARLEAGDALAAAAAFEAALAADPRSGELHLWLGRARAASGDLPGAIEAATRSLEIKKIWAPAHYNRACWRARAGDLELAAADLAVALDAGELDLLAVASDTDLDPLRADPRYRDRVPARALPASLEALAEPVFLGAEWSVTLSASVRPDEDLRVSFDGALPPEMVPARVIEDSREEGALESRSVQFTFRVAGAGGLGPWRAESGGLRATLAPAAYEFLAPEGHAPPTGGALALLDAPSLAFAGLEGVGAARDGERVLIRAEPGDRIRAQPAARSLKVERRVRGQPVWVGRVVAAPAGATVEVTITRAGQPIFERTL